MAPPSLLNSFSPVLKVTDIVAYLNIQKIGPEKKVCDNSDSPTKLSVYSEPNVSVT